MDGSEIFRSDSEQGCLAGNQNQISRTKSKNFGSEVLNFNFFSLSKMPRKISQGNIIPFIGMVQLHPNVWNNRLRAGYNDKADSWEAIAEWYRRLPNDGRVFGGKEKMK